MNIKELIMVKITEHLTEVEGCNKLVDNFRKSFESSKNDRSKSIEHAQQIMLLKDKMIFHKAAVATLEDLLKDLNNAKS